MNATKIRSNVRGRILWMALCALTFTHSAVAQTPPTADLFWSHGLAEDNDTAYPYIHVVFHSTPNTLAIFALAPFDHHDLPTTNNIVDDAETVLERSFAAQSTGDYWADFGTGRRTSHLVTCAGCPVYTGGEDWLAPVKLTETHDPAATSGLEEGFYDFDSVDHIWLRGNFFYDGNSLVETGTIKIDKPTAATVEVRAGMCDLDEDLLISHLVMTNNGGSADGVDFEYKKNGWHSWESGSTLSPFDQKYSYRSTPEILDIPPYDPDQPAKTVTIRAVYRRTGAADIYSDPKSITCSGGTVGQ